MPPIKDKIAASGSACRLQLRAEDIEQTPGVTATIYFVDAWVRGHWANVGSDRQRDYALRLMGRVRFVDLGTPQESWYVAD